MMRKASYVQSGSAPRSPPRRLRRSGTGTALFRAAASFMGTTWINAHSCPSLVAEGCIHRIDAHVRSRVASNGLSCGWPISPARSMRLWASRAAAHSSRPRGDCRQSHSLAIWRKWIARNARLSFRVPGGGSSCRMRFSARASAPPPSLSGAISQPASRDRSNFTADTYADTVSAR
eukprot:4923624-Pleurochrysis_carterae.AAC.1